MKPGIHTLDLYRKIITATDIYYHLRHSTLIIKWLRLSGMFFHIRCSFFIKLLNDIFLFVIRLSKKLDVYNVLCSERDTWQLIISLFKDRLEETYLTQMEVEDEALHSSSNVCRKMFVCKYLLLSGDFKMMFKIYNLNFLTETFSLILTFFWLFFFFLFHFLLKTNKKNYNKNNLKDKFLLHHSVQVTFLFCYYGCCLIDAECKNDLKKKINKIRGELVKN